MVSQWPKHGLALYLSDGSYYWFSSFYISESLNISYQEKEKESKDVMYLRTFFSILSDKSKSFYEPNDPIKTIDKSITYDRLLI